MRMLGLVPIFATLNLSAQRVISIKTRQREDLPNRGRSAAQCCADLVRTAGRLQHPCTRQNPRQPSPRLWQAFMPAQAQRAPSANMRRMWTAAGGAAMAHVVLEASKAAHVDSGWRSSNGTRSPRSQQGGACGQRLAEQQWRT
eukprot:SAG11_NODE_280_length_11266_cov_28.949499_7_plen_143_part_00